MEDIGKIIESISSLLWPLIFIVIIILFRGAISAVIDTAKNRKFTLKVAGNELTMEQASEQQRVILSDLQKKVVELETLINDSKVENTNDNTSRLSTNIEPALKKVLWVDDRPENNSYLISSLKDMDVEVHIAKSTIEGMMLFNSDSFDRVISDMGRPESKHAGLNLLKEIRKINNDIPFYFFCGSWAAKNLKDIAVKNGANGITSSGTSLIRMLIQESD